jgi:hypothetical protein
MSLLECLRSVPDPRRAQALGKVPERGSSRLLGMSRMMSFKPPRRLCFRASGSTASRARGNQPRAMMTSFASSAAINPPNVNFTRNYRSRRPLETK